MKLRDLLNVYVWRESIEIYGKNKETVFDPLYQGINENVPDQIMDAKVVLFEALTNQKYRKPYLFVIVKDV